MVAKGSAMNMVRLMGISNTASSGTPYLAHGQTRSSQLKTSLHDEWHNGFCISPLWYRARRSSDLPRKLSVSDQDCSVKPNESEVSLASKRVYLYKDGATTDRKSVV